MEGDKRGTHERPREKSKQVKRGAKKRRKRDGSKKRAVGWEQPEHVLTAGHRKGSNRISWLDSIE